MGGKRGGIGLRRGASVTKSRPPLHFRVEEFRNGVSGHGRGEDSGSFHKSYSATQATVNSKGNAESKRSNTQKRQGRGARHFSKNESKREKKKSETLKMLASFCATTRTKRGGQQVSFQLP